MRKIIPGKQKHLSLEDRLFIEQSLNQGLSFKEIAKYLCKDPSTISKEVKNHRASDWYHKGSFLNKKNFCVHRYQCRKKMSVRTMYSYIDQGIFTSKNIDLKRKVTFKPRKCHKTQISNREIFHGRSYEDFLKLGLNAFIEMDTVHSCRDSQKTLLTAERFLRFSAIFPSPFIFFSFLPIGKAWEGTSLILPFSIREQGGMQ